MNVPYLWRTRPRRPVMVRRTKLQSSFKAASKPTVGCATTVVLLYFTSAGGHWFEPRIGRFFFQPSAQKEHYVS